MPRTAPARFANQPALDAIWLDDDQRALHAHMPEAYSNALFEMRACCSLEIEGLFSHDAALFSIRSCRADFGPAGVNRGYWLLHEVQSLARDQERQANHDEEWSTGHRGRLPSVRHQDLQDRRRNEVALF